MTKSVLAFDFGTKSIGVAVGHSLVGTANELRPLKANDGVPRWEDVEALLKEWQPELLVVGLPLNMDGSESELCGRARKFSNRLHGRFGIQVELVDERLTSFDAKQIAMERRQKLDYAKNPVDSIAARLILEGWMRESR